MIDRIDDHFDRLLVLGRLNEQTLDSQTGWRTLLLDLLEARVALLNNNLEILITGAIRETNKNEVFLLFNILDPSSDLVQLAIVLIRVIHYILDP